jgi:hypothetical protein
MNGLKLTAIENSIVQVKDILKFGRLVKSKGDEGNDYTWHARNLEVHNIGPIGEGGNMSLLFKHANVSLAHA